MTVLYFKFTLSGIPAFHTEQRSSLSIGPWVALSFEAFGFGAPEMFEDLDSDIKGRWIVGGLHAVTRDSMEQNLTNCGIVDLEQVSTRTGTRKQSHDGVAKASSLSWRAQRCRMSLTSETWNRPRCVRREMRLVMRCEVRGELGNPSAEITNIHPKSACWLPVAPHVTPAEKRWSDSGWRWQKIPQIKMFRPWDELGGFCLDFVGECFLRLGDSC